MGLVSFSFDLIFFSVACTLYRLFICKGKDSTVYVNKHLKHS